MRRRVFALACLLTCLSALVPVAAQEGHPLTGTWSGDWGASASTRTHVTMVFAWDGKTISATINPGPGATAIPNVYLDVTNWTVRFEADTKDASGATVHLSAEGKLEELSSYHRTLKGAWQQGATKGDFKLTRD